MSDLRQIECITDHGDIKQKILWESYTTQTVIALEVDSHMCNVRTVSITEDMYCDTGLRISTIIFEVVS